MIDKALREQVWRRITRNLVTEGRIPKGEVVPEIMFETRRVLQEGITKGMATEGWYGKEEDFLQLQNQLRINVHYFAAFKSHAQLREVTDLVLTEKGSIRNWSDFKKQVMPKVLAIDKRYQENWLQAEYELAVSSSQMAVRWKQMEHAGVEMLEFRTAGDERVRHSHALLDRTRKPRTDSFWDVYWPPIAWCCRCTAAATMLEETPDFEGIEIPEMFRNNPGKTGVLYKENHPYFSKLPKGSFKKVFEKATELFEEIDPASDNYKTVYNSWVKYQSFDPEQWERRGFNPKTGSFLVAEKYAWKQLENHEKDFYTKILENKSTLKIQVLTDYDQVPKNLLPINHPKQPDCLINSQYWEIKSFLNVKNFGRRLRDDIHRKSKKQCKDLILDFRIEDLPANVVRQSIWQATKSSEVQRIWIWNNLTPLREKPFSRSEILKNVLNGYF